MGTHSFLGEYRYSIDSKGRVNLPARLRKALPESADDTFIVTRGLHENILVYSLEEWKRLEEGLRRLSLLDPVHRIFIRQTTRFATPCKLDSQGRIAIPQSLLDFAHITKEVIIIGLLSEIEIWDPATLARYEESEFQLDSEDFTNLAKELRTS